MFVEGLWGLLISKEISNLRITDPCEGKPASNAWSVSIDALIVGRVVMVALHVFGQLSWRTLWLLTRLAGSRPPQRIAKSDACRWNLRIHNLQMRCRWNLRIHNLQMRCRDLTRMRGYRDSNPRNGHQVTHKTCQARGVLLITAELWQVFVRWI